MSRYADDWDDDREFAVLDMGRWQRNTRAALKSQRGRKALAEIREALLALPEKRLIEGALCTVGGPERVPMPTDADVDAYVARRKANGMWQAWDSREKSAELLHGEAEERREVIAENTAEQGTGVCVNGALIWHRLVQQGKSPDEAFAALPAVVDDDGDGDPLGVTAEIAEKEAGIAYTLAWNLAYRNDETFGRMTPEERYTAFLAWINSELDDQPATETAGSAA